MVKALAFSLLTGAEAGTLAVTWEDCGSQHSKITDLQPTSIMTGGTTTLTGVGTVDEDVTSAQFSATIKALGVKVASCSGDATEDIVCNLPLGAGKITVKKVDFPLQAGEIPIPVDVKTIAVIPASLEKVDAHIEAVDQNGESVICMDVHTSKAWLSVDTTVAPVTTTTMPTKHGAEFVEGLVLGILSDDSEPLSCVLGGVASVAVFSQAFDELKEGKISQAIDDLSDGLGLINPTVKHCGAAKVEVENLVDGLKSITPAKAAEHFKAHRSEILENVAQASKCRDNEDYTGMGTQVGIVLRKIIEEDVVV